MLKIYYHRDFDGIASAAILAHILREVRGEISVGWSGVNHDVRPRWRTFSEDERFAVVDFFYHPRAEYWFDHHPTTFVVPEWKQLYAPSARHRWDTASPSCPPVILEHAREHWDFQPPARFEDLKHWSNKIDAARFDSVEEVLFGNAPALRIMRALTVAPAPDWSDFIVRQLVDHDLESVAGLGEIEKRHERACKNREKALEQFPPTVVDIEDGVLLYDATSNEIRRERFAAFYFHPEVHFAVGMIPTRGGLHVTAGENPWNLPRAGIDVGRMCERHGGGGHPAVGGVNPADARDCKRIARSLAVELRAQMRRFRSGA
ncbi:MAG: hypothetical protein JNM84_03080 [Planctomycetes bacterium]|nr:hypothetical protein [Planctomycetota bacterium]